MGAEAQDANDALFEEHRLLAVANDFDYDAEATKVAIIDSIQSSSETHRSLTISH